MFEKHDEQLVAQALKGNKRAWMALVTRYEKSIYHYGLRMTGNPADAADLMQDIFVSVFRSLANYRGDGAFKGWLFRIAHFRCIEFYRKRKPEQSMDDVPEPECGRATPEGEVLNDSTSQSLLAAMQRLPLSQKAVVELKFFGQFTFDEIADQMGLSPNTVKSRLYSALSRLKLDLEVEHAQA
ncbi:sigma-70 family RNA polymerase sigma factor [Aestuariibacter sp. A3R04]|uniref:RNA polymerase sigma factor n=1 Tax=Aestuariibacter sp. A3R04 TaxID=2841571 RepID=UPI001C09302C|nr:sigma-70 family RNA polymerase sigma factor [Aestuariibacter sp. A3R04]